MKLGRPRNDEFRIEQDKLDTLMLAAEKYKDLYPSIFMVPNVAQYRALEAMYAPVNDAGKIPDMTSVEFANGVGKSHLMILDMIGWTMGRDFLCEEMYPEAALRAYDEAKCLRDKGLLSLRLVCVSDDMKAGGSVLELLKQIFPCAKIGPADNSKCHRQIDISHPSKQGIKNSITVKTFDQDRTAHSGSTCNRIWINEPMPDELWGETQARIRSKKGEQQGSIGMFATILDLASYLDGLEDSTKFILARCRGHLYENCVDEEVTDEMAAEVAEEIGIYLEKCEDGPGYVTHGVLTRETIEAKIEGWAQGSPHELDARKSGRPISAGGKIWPTFNKDVHVIPDDTYEKSLPICPVGQVVDPHPARPDASLWFQLLPSDRIAIIDEWPTYQEFGYFDKIKETRFTVPEKCEIWQLFESTRGYYADGNRVGDPNRFREPNSNDPGMLLDQYVVHGFDYNIDIIDDLEYGHELVNQYLWVNQQIRQLAPNDPAAQPRLVIYDRCVNVKRAMANYSRKSQRDKTKSVSEMIDKKHACFAGLVRYLVVWHQNHRYDDVKRDENYMDDQDRLKMGRIPGSMRATIGDLSINTHGRQIHSVSR